MTRAPALLCALFSMGCNMQRTGGEESIPRVLFTHEAAVTYCQHDGETRVGDGVILSDLAYPAILLVAVALYRLCAADARQGVCDG